MDQEKPEPFFRVLGAAVADSWSELPRHVQERLFENAVRFGQTAEHGASLRERLARFLHDHNDRTSDATPVRMA
jgi:hypothetical protein